jgi:hypothetical protein
MSGESAAKRARAAADAAREAADEAVKSAEAADEAAAIAEAIESQDHLLDRAAVVDLNEVHGHKKGGPTGDKNASEGGGGISGGPL